MGVGEGEWPRGVAKEIEIRQKKTNFTRDETLFYVR